MDSENKILMKERKEMLKMHEDSMKALQDSASAEINRLKEELAILKDQKQAADEKNLRHSEAFKLLQQEKESLVDIVWQAKTRVAELLNVDVFVPRNTIDIAYQDSSESHHSADVEGDSPTGDDAASKSPAPKE